MQASYLSPVVIGAHAKLSFSFTRPADTTQYGIGDAVGISLAVSGATNATPIEITTSAAHGLLTGARVTIAGVGGNTAANGNWVITKTASNKFTLDDSVGNGAYTAGGTVAIAMYFALASLLASGYGRIVSARIVADSAVVTNGSFRLWLFASQPTATVDNATFPLLWADRASRLGYLDFTLATGGTGSDCGEAIATTDIEYDCDSDKNLFALLEARAAYTPTSSELFYIELTMERYS